MNQVDEPATSNAQQPPLSLETASGATSQTTSNMLRVPSSGYGGAIPRRPFSRDSSVESTSSSAADTTKTCFCGHYTEGPSGPSSKRGRCKFCRSRAKYVSGQRSFDASRLFGRRRERGEPRRAASEDQRKRDRGSTAEDNEKTIDERTSSAGVEAIASTSSLDFDVTSTTSQRRLGWRLKPSVRRQARLELDVPSAANSGVTVSGGGPSNSIAGSTSPSGSRDHGLRTPPGPPTMPPSCPGGPSLPGTVTSSSTPSSLSHARQSIGVRRPTTLHHASDPTVQNSQRYATHMMASDMSGLLAPPSRSGALYRAHTDPTSSNSNYECNQQKTPNSPPPTYEEVMKQAKMGKEKKFNSTSGLLSQLPISTANHPTLMGRIGCPSYVPRVAPPSYEEALSSRVVTSLRLASQQHHLHSSASSTVSSGGPGGQIRSLSEDRATSHPSPPPPFRGRNSSGSNLRPLTRSSRVEEIPDIYWEQAARELDFCTCRKCQARYRQYFEEDLADPNNDAEAMIPMETQVLMQEVLTDGMAFCSLM